MEEDIIQSIKDVAHRVSEDYLLFGKNMNDSIIDSYMGGEIGNDEIVKRICEHANQNVYLGLFNDLNVNKSNIIFDIADFNKIIPVIRESETAMEALKAPPKDFRSNFANSTLPDRQNETAGEIEDDQLNEAKSVEKNASELYAVIQCRDTLKNFLSKIDMMKCAEEKLAEESYNKMRHDAKMIVAKGDSLGDLAKIAARGIKEYGCDFTKVAEAYDMIGKELSDNRFIVNNEFTKLSSMKINQDAEILKPVFSFNSSILKLAGLNDLSENVSKSLEAFNKLISEEIK